uniref:Glyoxylate reductase hydroxypyruvate reductase-like protein n=1 Tax=Triatoma infestans TaxID=30076 RepID=A0A161M3B6_TRIIF
MLGNTQNVIDDCAAEVAIMLALSVAHRAKEGFNKIKNGEWVTGSLQVVIRTRN